MTKFNLTNGLVLLLLALSFACANNPKVTELKPDSDPQVELDKVAANIELIQARQADVLSPVQYGLAKDSWDKAVKMRNENKSQKDILHEIALAQAHVDQANLNTDVAVQILHEPITARREALEAKAKQDFPSELAAADKDLVSITSQIEDKDTSSAESRAAGLAASYRKIELDSIKKEKLGPGQDSIKEAIEEGAKKLTPETLAWANKKFSEDEASIEQNPHNAGAVEKASKDATATGARLLKLVRAAKNSTAKNPEETALQLEKGELAVSQSNKKLTSVESELSDSQTKMIAADASNQQLEGAVALDKKIALAMTKFSKNEAEVYRQGDSLLLRLKGLSFAKNKSELGSENFALLTKVQGVIAELGLSQVAIEGHTDSIGGKVPNETLSLKRAESVRSYLVANNNVAADKTTVSGLGFAKPIATNKTAEGRAQNRRVDIIITPVSN